MKLIKVLSGILTSLACYGLFVVIVANLKEETHLILHILLMLLLCVLCPSILIFWSEKRLNKELSDNYQHLASKHEREGAHKLAELLTKTPELHKLIDVEVPIFDGKGDEIGHGYGHGTVADLIRDNF